MWPHLWHVSSYKKYWCKTLHESVYASHSISWPYLLCVSRDTQVHAILPLIGWKPRHLWIIKHLPSASAFMPIIHQVLWLHGAMNSKKYDTNKNIQIISLMGGCNRFFHQNWSYQDVKVILKTMSKICISYFNSIQSILSQSILSEEYCKLECGT